jgi:hypothetical protein
MRLTTVLLASALLLTSNTVSAEVDRTPGSGDEVRHFVLEPDRALTDVDRRALAAQGVEVQDALSNGRVLVRVRDAAANMDALDAVGSVAPLTARRKVFRSAVQEAISGRAFARLNVVFQRDVDFEDARRVIENAGGTLQNPFQTAFTSTGLIAALVPSTALMDVGADERVLLVHGPNRLRPVADNTLSAQLSNVKTIQEAPYGLTGQGVVLSFFELAAAFAAHQEFGGRLTTHFTGGSSGDVSHATHVAGTMIASGLDSAAKGFAPNATLHQFDARGDDLFELKEEVSDVKAVADNNSWGYVLGWCTAPACTGWEWGDTAELYGYYDAQYTAPIDQISRANGVLFVHSSGNDAQKNGPIDLWSTHFHVNNDGDRIPNRTYCYSRDGSGNDCPAPTCTAGFCETAKHPRMSGQLPDPWISLGLLASAKNIITVGSVDTDKVIATSSSRGPARDGRVKPEVVARGVQVYSSIPGGAGNAHSNSSGTSMATPQITGTAALLTEQWRRTFSGADPGPTVLKTLIIAGAQDIGNAGPDYTHGFGFLDAKAAADLIIADAAQGRRIKQASIAQGAEIEIPVTVTAPQTLRVTLGWDDPPVFLLADDPLDASTLVNDLDVRVVDPAGNTVLPYVLDRTQPDALATRGVNKVDTTEMIEVKNAAPGTYRVIVSGSRVAAESPQKFVLAINAETGALPVPCNELNEPNGDEASAFGLVANGQTVSARTCQANDVDFYTFVVGAAGPVSATVTSTGTPLRVTLYSSATSPVTADVPTNGNATVTTQLTSSTPTTFYVKIEAIGAVGAATSYTVVPSFPGAPGKHRRSVRR